MPIKTKISINIENNSITEFISIEELQKVLDKNESIYSVPSHKIIEPKVTEIPVNLASVQKYYKEILADLSENHEALYAKFNMILDNVISYSLKNSGNLNDEELYTTVLTVQLEAFLKTQHVFNNYAKKHKD